MAELNTGQTYPPMAIIANATEALAFHAARERDHATNETRAAALTADLSRG